VCIKVSVSKGVLKFGVYIYNKWRARLGGIGGQDFKKKAI